MKLSELHAELFDLMIAAPQFLLVESVGVVPLEQLSVRLMEVATKFLLVHGATDDQDARMSTCAPSWRASGCP